MSAAPSGGLGPPRDIGELIRRRVAAELGITASVGIAASKFVAKIASTRCKPDGLLLIGPERDRPLPSQPAGWCAVGSRSQDCGCPGPDGNQDRGGCRRHAGHPLKRCWAPPASMSTGSPGGSTRGQSPRCGWRRASGPRKPLPWTPATMPCCTGSCCGCPTALPSGCALPGWWPGRWR